MARLMWDVEGRRFYETGLDRCVLYPTRLRGYAWNGMISVSEAPTSSDPRPYYIDGIKYHNAPGPEEFAGTITAFTYPEQFDSLQGLESIGTGLYVDQQFNKSFGLCYRSLIGNDTVGDDYGYKLHLVYNAMVTSGSNDRRTKTNAESPINFSWPFTTTPVQVNGKRHSAHLIIDSRETNRNLLRTLEDRLYGKSGKNPYLPTPNELIDLFETYQPTGYGYGPYGHTTYGHGSEY